MTVNRILFKGGFPRSWEARIPCSSVGLVVFHFFSHSYHVNALFVRVHAVYIFVNNRYKVWWTLVYVHMYMQCTCMWLCALWSSSLANTNILFIVASCDVCPTSSRPFASSQGIVRTSFQKPFTGPNTEAYMYLPLVQHFVDVTCHAVCLYVPLQCTTLGSWLYIATM